MVIDSGTSLVVFNLLTMGLFLICIAYFFFTTYNQEPGYYAKFDYKDPMTIFILSLLATIVVAWYFIVTYVVGMILRVIGELRIKKLVFKKGLRK